MEAEVSRQLVEELITSFLSTAAGLDLRERIAHPETLPMSSRRTIESPPGEKLIWVAWTAAAGIIVATGRYDHERSHQIGTHVLQIEWWIPPDTHHASWWRADPERLGEWTAGRGHGVWVSTSGPASGGPSGLPHVSAAFPADLPYVTAVGGTSLGIPNASGGFSEVGWGTNENLIDASPPIIEGFVFGGGGGASVYFAKPAYQSGLTGNYRQVPDVAADACNPLVFQDQLRVES